MASCTGNHKRSILTIVGNNRIIFIQRICIIKGCSSTRLFFLESRRGGKRPVPFSSPPRFKGKCCHSVACEQRFLSSMDGFWHLRNRSRLLFFFVLFALTTRLTSDAKSSLTAEKPLLLARWSFSIIKPKYGAKLFCEMIFPYTCSVQKTKTRSCIFHAPRYLWKHYSTIRTLISENNNNNNNNNNK